MGSLPELPDIVVYIEALERRVLGQRLAQVRIASPFLLRTVEPPLNDVRDKQVREIRRCGKRIALGFEDDLWLLLHLMIAGRLHWRDAGAKLAGRSALAAFDFPSGTVVLTEAGSKKRASVHVFRGRNALRARVPGAVEVLEADFHAFSAALTLRNHTLKRALTDPRLLSGIGNAYSDEILHLARLSPLGLTRKLASDEMRRLYEAARQTLTSWIDRLRAEAGGGFPRKVTAFREGMAVHGRYGKSCPDCGAPIQRIRYAENETNYCPPCQTGGRLLADRALSRLLKKDWPLTLEELEALGGPPECRKAAH